MLISELLMQLSRFAPLQALCEANCLVALMLSGEVAVDTQQANYTQLWTCRRTTLNSSCVWNDTSA